MGKGGFQNHQRAHLHNDVRREKGTSVAVCCVLVLSIDIIAAGSTTVVTRTKKTLRLVRASTRQPMPTSNVTGHTRRDVVSRSYSSNEEIVAKASGGDALYGMNFFPTTAEIVTKPYSPVLSTPSYVQM